MKETTTAEMSVPKPVIPFKMSMLKGDEIVEAAPEILSGSPMWCSMRDEDKRLFWAIYEKLWAEAKGFRSEEEIYMLTDIQYGIVTERPDSFDKSSKDVEARLKRQKAWFEQMEKLRRDKGETIQGIKDIQAAVMAVKNGRGEIKAWMLEFSDEEVDNLDSEAVKDDAKSE